MTTQSGIRGGAPRSRTHRRCPGLWSACLALVVVVLSPLSPRPAAADVSFDQRMLELVNQRRAAAGVAALQASPTLATVAGPGPYTGCGPTIGGRSVDMGVRNYFSHTIAACGGRTVYDVLAATPGLTYSAAAENIAWMNGTSDPLVAAERLVNDLMASASHRQNILDSRFTHVGIGSWATPAGQTWSGAGVALTRVWIATQVFAALTPAPAPVVVSPGAPQDVVATGGDGRLSVTWRAPASGPPPTGYGVYVYGAAGFTGRSLQTCATCLQATISALDNGADYYAAVYAHDAASWGPVANSGWVSVLAVPGAPPATVAVPGDGSLTISWEPPATPGARVDGYGVVVYDANGFTGKYVWACATCRSATVTGLTNGVSYYPAVHAHNANGWGAGGVWTWIVAGTPATPTDVVATPGAGSVSVSWRAPADNGVPRVGYGVLVFDANGYTGRYVGACAGCTSATVGGLSGRGPFTAQVYAYNDNGWGLPGRSGPVTL